MDEERLVDASQRTCSHETERLYTQRCLDILNGFDLTFTRCINCHKIVNLEAKKIQSQ
jgi:hypothetical protein